MKDPLTTRDYCVIAIFAALTAVLSQLIVPLPFTPVQISCGLVAVHMTGILLKPRQALLSQLTYLLVGLIGLPVYGNFRGGPAALFGPTGGYLMVYPVMALIVSLALERLANDTDKRKLSLHCAVFVCIAQFVLYVGGTAWLSLISGNSFMASLALAVYPFIPLDIIKILFCVFAVTPLRGRFRAMGLL